MNKFKDALITFAVSAIVMTALPTISLHIAGATSVMGLSILFLLILNPVAMLLIGIYSGKKIKTRWYLPIISACVFISSALSIYALDTAFLIYTIHYLILSFGVMFITSFITRKKTK